MRLRITLPVLALCLTAFQAEAQTAFDARIDGYIGLRYPCGGGVQPVLRIQNSGTQTMTSCDIDVFKNGFSVNVFHWVLASAAGTGQYRQPALGTLNGVQPGDELKFNILTVNGQPDEDATGNLLVVPMTDEKGDAGSYQVQVKVLTDDHPGETSWKLKDALGTTVAQSPAYTEGGVLVETPVALAPGTCFNFEVSDAGGDGFGEAREPGFAKVTSLGADVVSVTGDFSSFFREGVVTGTQNGCMTTQLTTTADPSISCGVSNLHLDGTSTVHAEPVPGANKYQFHFTNVAGQPAYARNIAIGARSLVLSQWSTLPLKRGRTYNVEVRPSFDNGATYCAFGPSCTVRIGYDLVQGMMVRSVSNVGEEASGADIILFPNPAPEGRFSVLLDGYDEEAGPMAVDLFSLTGQKIMARSIALDVSGGPIPVALDGMAPGLYLVRITVGDAVATQRLLIP